MVHEEITFRIRVCQITALHDYGLMRQFECIGSEHKHRDDVKVNHPEMYLSEVSGINRPDFKSQPRSLKSYILPS
jgi:hypothetical protein